MRTKDQIIEHQGMLIMELAKIAQYKIQEVINLMEEIEELPKDEELIDLPVNVINIKNHVQKKEKICPRCKKAERPILKSGKRATYCRRCKARKTKERQKI